MILAHNLQAMNADRMFGINSKSQAKSTEKLSSGYKINRAADDAAGLAISEKMRRQIRGLKQAVENAQDGISMVQIADGAMAEVHAMLDRGIELTVKAANGTMSPSDLEYIQEEIDELLMEIDMIPEKTKFNEIYVLKGLGWEEGAGPQKPGVVITGGDLPLWVKRSPGEALTQTYKGTYDVITATTGVVKRHVEVEHASAWLDFSDIDKNKVKQLKNGGFYTTCCTCNNYYSIRFTDGKGSNLHVSYPHYVYEIGVDGVKDAKDLLDRIIKGTENGNPLDHYTIFKADGAKLIIYDDRSRKPLNGDAPDANAGEAWKDWNNHAWDEQDGVAPHGDQGIFGPGVAYAPGDPVGGGGGGGTVNQDASLQVGADAGDRMEIELPYISAKKLGVAEVDVTKKGGPEDGITAFVYASQYVSGERSRMGAYQNRLEHTIANLNNVVENTQAAESAIRDTDMATEMVFYSNQNILQQVGQSILAQANKSSDGVLSLLQ